MVVVDLNVYNFYCGKCGFGCNSNFLLGEHMKGHAIVNPIVSVVDPVGIVTPAPTVQYLGLGD